MPLSFGVPVGVAIALVGAIMLLSTKRKNLALGFLGVGAIIALLTLTAIIMAVNSSM